MFWTKNLIQYTLVLHSAVVDVFYKTLQLEEECATILS